MPAVLCTDCWLLEAVSKGLDKYLGILVLTDVWKGEVQAFTYALLWQPP